MKVATHDGGFHADETFALAALTLGGEPLEIVRTRDAAALAACDVRVDVGLRDDPATGDFDHHQAGGAGGRPNGVAYASFGLVWKAFGERLCDGDAEVAARIDELLVQGVDANDTGQELSAPLIAGASAMTVSDVIYALNPVWDEDESPAELAARFSEAVALAAGILEREIRTAAAQVRAATLVRGAIRRAEDPRVIELERSLPWQRELIAGAPEALFVIYPRRDGWALHAVPRKLGAFENRLDLPEPWAGRSGADLVAVTGVPDAVFCRTARFYAAAGSREGITALARLALDDGAGSPRAGS
jgi:uncharacterized UPF0160 family protein